MVPEHSLHAAPGTQPGCRKEWGHTPQSLGSSGPEEAAAMQFQEFPRGGRQAYVGEEIPAGGPRIITSPGAFPGTASRSSIPDLRGAQDLPTGVCLLGPQAGGLAGVAWAHSWGRQGRRHPAVQRELPGPL